MSDGVGVFTRRGWDSTLKDDDSPEAIPSLPQPVEYVVLCTKGIALCLTIEAVIEKLYDCSAPLGELRIYFKGEADESSAELEKALARAGFLGGGDGGRVH